MKTFTFFFFTKAIFTVVAIAVQSTAFSQNSLVITELMINPVGVADAEGEWIEIHNTSRLPVRLNKFKLTSGTASSTIQADTAIEIAPGQFFVLGLNKDATKNGGVKVDYEYSSINLGNTGSDDVSILDSNDVLVDMVTYSSSKAGVSKSLSPIFFTSSENDAESNWCDGSTPYTTSDKGTPGKANDACGVINGVTIIEDDPSASITIAPNPASDELKIIPRTLFIPNQEIRVYDATGQLIHTETFSSTTCLKTSTWENGLYMLTIWNESFKIFIQH